MRAHDDLRLRGLFRHHVLLLWDNLLGRQLPREPLVGRRGCGVVVGV